MQLTVYTSSAWPASAAAARTIGCANATRYVFQKTEGQDMRFKISASILDAALVCVSDEATRHYLNGVYFESAGGSSVRLVATDGHILFQGVSRIDWLDGASLTEPVILGFGVQKRYTGFTCRSLPKAGNGYVTIDVAAGVARIGRHSVQVTRVVGMYPDFGRLMPDVVSNEPAQFGEKVHSAIHEVGRRIGAEPVVFFNGQNPAPVVYEGAPNVVVLAMPLRVPARESWPPANLRGGKLVYREP